MFLPSPNVRSTKKAFPPRRNLFPDRSGDSGTTRRRPYAAQPTFEIENALRVLIRRDRGDTTTPRILRKGHATRSRESRFADDDIRRGRRSFEARCCCFLSNRMTIAAVWFEYGCDGRLRGFRGF